MIRQSIHHHQLREVAFASLRHTPAVTRVDKAVAELARVSGEPFVSEPLVWENGLYPHRIPVKFVQVLLAEHRPPDLGKSREAITSEVGPQYDWLIITQRPMPSEGTSQSSCQAVRLAGSLSVTWSPIPHPGASGGGVHPGVHRVSLMSILEAIARVPQYRSLS